MANPFQQIKDIWNRLPMSGRISTVGAIIATLGLIGALFYYGSRSEYGVLFSDLKPEDAQTIVEKLKAANVPYALANNGTAVQVPTERISELRLQMASAGVLSGGHVGFDLFDKTNFGATDFAQQVNYRRAIEGELSKTLEGMDEVESVRVHITPKKESVFTEKEEGAKASVMLRVKQGKQLSEERTEAIVNLVSSSVEGLDPASVSVMDTRGRVLTSGRGKNAGLNNAGSFQAQLEARQKYEAENAARVIALLEPVVGEGRVRANVAADVDFSQVEQTEETYNPKSQVVRSQQNVQENKQTSMTNGVTQNGVTGTRSNDPTTPPTQPQQNQTGNDNRASTTTNYEIDKTVKRTVGGGGRVSRINVSVVVDYKNANGVEVARTVDEVKQIQDLVSAAVGADQNRGDSVVVQTMAFSKLPDEGATNANWFDRNKQFVSGSVKYVALVLVALLLLFFVVRPAHRSLKVALAPPSGEPHLLPPASPADIDMRHAKESREQQLAENNLAEIKPMMTVAELESQLDHESEDAGIKAGVQRAEKVKKLVAEQTMNNPEMVVSTLRGWLKEG